MITSGLQQMLVSQLSMFDSKLSHSLRHSSTLYVINANVMQNFSAVTLCFVELFGLLGLVIKSAPPPPHFIKPPRIERYLH